MRMIDADALIEFCAERWIPLNIDAVNMQPTIQPEKAQLYCKGTTSDLVSRQAAIDALDAIGHIATMSDGDKCVRRSAVKYTLSMLPSAQQEHKVRFADKDHVWIDGKQYISLRRFQEAVKEAQPKEGHWIEVAGELECSECHTVFTDLYPDYADSVACPHCGAKMTISTK